MAELAELSPVRKAACRRHDKSTMAATVPLVGLTLYAAVVPSQPVHETLAYAITLYIGADTVYHALVPHCQPSGHRVATIMLHHALSLSMCAHSLAHPEHAHIGWRLTLVEANTLVHNANKVLRWRALNVAFYLSETRPRPPRRARPTHPRPSHAAAWVSLRLVWCPYVALLLHDLMKGWPRAQYAQTVGAHVGICALNYYWTAEVIIGMVRPRKRRRAD